MGGIARSVARAVASPVARAVVSGDSGSGTDAAAAAYFAAVEGAGGSFDLSGINATYTAEYMQAAISDLVSELKTESLWNLLTEVIMLGGVTYAGLAPKLKYKSTATMTLNNFVIGDFVGAGSGAGLKGNASNKYIDTGYIFPDASNCTLWCYLTEADSASGSRYYMGANPGGSSAIGLGHLISGTRASFQHNVSGDNNAFLITAKAAYFLLGTRRSSTERVLFRNGAKVHTNPNNDTPTSFDGDEPLNLFRPGVTGVAPTNARILAAGLAETDLNDSQCLALMSAINTWATAIGANTY